MRKIILVSLCVIMNLVNGYSQTTATNFTANDCKSNSHTLFTELDAGKIIALVWIMPCAMCINDAVGAYNAVQSFASSHSGKVLYYLIDDVGDAGCSSLSTWATTNGIDASKITIFDNSGNVIKENDYGGNGMPHVAIVGGTDHKIYINKLNGSNNQADFESAISSALNTNVPGSLNKETQLNVFPNPASSKLSVNYTIADKSEVELSIFNSLGAKIKTLNSTRIAGQHNVDIDIKGISSGVYWLELKTPIGTNTVKFVIAN